MRDRPLLPTDHRTLPSLDPIFGTTLDAGLVDLGLVLPSGVRAAVEAQARLLLAWNDSVNLSAHGTPERIAREHVTDSLTAWPLLGGIASLLDLGSGAGYPGLPLAVALPVPRVALVDSIGKKVRFLEAAAAAALQELRAAGQQDSHPGDRPLPAIAALNARAEDLARERAHREAWDVVTARAVAPMVELIELCLPLLRIGGRLVAWKRDDGAGSLERELAAAAGVGQACGGASPAIHRVAARGLEDHRLVLITKRRATPREFPRLVAERRRALLR
ncbi:MAG: 16S rRNA (guanine(527)-N(7))-methyltransferase RsmG [Chloroflexota bacterium]|nr:16S rRNA (guanine(527)-N(7))-methyltransferase RsmG [Chloroflexota bacterium]